MTEVSHATRKKTELMNPLLDNSNGLTFNFSKVTMLARGRRWGQRKLLESWFIHADPILVKTIRGPLSEIFVDLVKP